MTNWQAAIGVAVLSAAAIGAPGLWMSSVATTAIEVHDTEMGAHPEQQRALQRLQSRQDVMANEVKHVNEELDDVKGELEGISAKLDTVLDELRRRP